MKILAIGDIHTKTWIIDEIEKLVHEYDAIVFCGDYADNWSASSIDSLMSWKHIKSFSDRYNKVRCHIGNHDFAYLHKEISGRSSGYDFKTQLLLNSPDNKELKEWLLSLPITSELDGVTFSHAGVTEEWNGDISVIGLWNDSSPIWTRPVKFGGWGTYKDIPQVFGHNPNECIWNPSYNSWCIDTFSEHRDNSPIGDYTVLEIIDGKEFNVIKINKYENNDHTTSIKD